MEEEPPDSEDADLFDDFRSEKGPNPGYFNVKKREKKTAYKNKEHEDP